jgi:GTP-binding protein HflX
MLLHIVDIGSETAAQQCYTVEDILKELGLADKPTLLALNKIDLLGGKIEPGDDEVVRRYIDQLSARVQAAAFISASKGWGLNRMLELIAEMLDNK